MKRFVGKAAVFLLPFVLLFALFFAFEPYDYFGLQGDSPYLSMPLSSMRGAMREHPTRIILGDSRMANLNTGYIREITGHDYAMLGFGGAQLGECIELFWFATQQAQLEECVFGINFYTAGGEQTAGRIPAIQKRADNLGDFVFHINYWLEAANTLKMEVKNGLAGLLNRPEWLEYPEDPTTFTYVAVPAERGEVYRKDLEDYAALIGAHMPDDFSITEDTYRQLFEVIDYCEENDIRLTFVFPPMHQSLFDLVQDRGFSDEIEGCKEILLERATVYDMQFPNPFNEDEDNFFDGFHLCGPQKQRLADLIFGGVESDTIVRYERQG